MKDLEVGITYVKNGKYYLAVNEKTLVTYEDGTFKVKNTYKDHEACRNLAVDELCKEWNISTTQLDELSPKYFTPKDCGQKYPSDRAARRRDQLREPPIRTVKFIHQ